MTGLESATSFNSHWGGKPMNRADAVSSEQGSTEAVDPGPRRSLVLFSDGTGNSSAKLFKTNVWRMYEAVDLGPDPDPREATQLAFYDNGVGTSSVKLLAMLGGILGWGLKRNVLEIYRYVCRNYRPGDSIYAFGFSRGAYTIRLVVALIGSQGVVPFDDERDLFRQTGDAYRAFQRKNNPNFIFWGAFIAALTRALRDAAIGVWRTLWRHPRFRPCGHTVPVAFVGVWDTVAAYGGPITEITRAIDNWIWPLTMTNEQLGPNVVRARHALALDDERDSFHPVLWDEVWESRRRDDLVGAISQAATAADRQRLESQLELHDQRLRQVWFSGMHADVGGGYPDESLSFVSLLWMMREAGAAGLRLLPDLVKRVQDLSTPLGPLHDSRQGLAGYYRYQPRKIDAYIHPKSPIGSQKLLDRTLSLRDPIIGEKKFRPQGLLMNCLVHDSVIARIKSGTDGYAPISLPEHFQITPPPAVPKLKGARVRPDLVHPDLVRNLQRRATERYERQETLWDLVYQRRLAYFLIVLLSFGIALTPKLVDASDASFGGRSVWEVFVAGVAALLPDLARPWLAVLAVAPLSILVPAGVIWLVKRLSAGREAKLRDGMRIAWREAANGVPVSGKADSRLRRQRTSRPYQLILQTLKWRIMPNVIGPLLILGFFWFLLVVFTQVRLVRDERGTSVCAATPVADLVEPSPEQGRLFHTDRACQRTKMRVRKGHRYQIEFKMVRQWQDGAHLASPLGLNSSDFPAGSWWKMYPASMLRRVVSARWMQPLYEIRAPATADGSRPRIFIDKLDLTRSGTAYIAQFEARLDGELMLFVNEATLPWQPVSYFYLSEPSGVNLGTALVQVTSLSPPDTAELPTGTTQQ